MIYFKFIRYNFIFKQKIKEIMKFELISTTKLLLITNKVY